MVEIASANSTSYDFKVLDFTLPDRVEPSQLVSIPIELENDGDVAWFTNDVSGTPVIQLGYTLNSVLEPTKTDLLTDVPDKTSAPNNLTDPEQKLEIIAPATEGTYSFEIVLFDQTNTAQYAASSSNVQTYSLVVENPPTPDVTSPTGSIEIDNGNEESSDTEIEVKLTANDPVISGEITSGVSEYILSQTPDFSDTTWQAFSDNEQVLNLVIPNAPNTYTFYAKFKDAVGNESEVYSDSISFVSTAPTGSIAIDVDEQVDVDGELQVQDNNLKLYLNATSNVHITEYTLSTDSDFSDDTWTTIETSENTFSTIVERTIEDTTGTYEFFVKYKNLYGDESVVYSANVHYQSYDITPSLELESQDVLFGDEMNLSATLKNSGVDIGYNARFEITLPKGFEYLHSMEYKEGDDELSEGGIEPTFVATNEEGLQVLVYEGIDDLLTGESTSIHARIAVGGEAEGYKLGDLVDIPISGQLFKQSNFTNGYEVSENLQVELQPFTVDFNSGGNNQGEQLVEEETENKLTIETNPDIASDPAIGEETTDGDLAEENPLVVQFELDNGTSYVEGSEQIMINGVLVDPEEYNITFLYFEDLVNEHPILRWVFNDTVAVDTLVEIYFDSKINKIEDETLLGIDFVEHEQNIEERLQVDGNYSNEGEETVTYTEEENNSITAKYFIVDKYATPWRTDINETVRYTIKIETSQDYDLSGIEIIDELPDGVNFSETSANISYSEDLLLNLFDYSVNSETGKEILTWRINAGDGIPAGTTYEFSYDVTIDANYDVKALEDRDDRIFSRDNLVSKVTVNGLWTDIEDGIAYDREETIDERKIEDTDWAGNRLLEVTFSEGIKHAYETEYSEELDVKIGDVLDVYGELTFPENTPTNNVNYRVYLPIGTELNGNFDITSDLGTVITPDKIDGGYLFELSKVEPGKTFKVEYQLNVLNDANLKEAVKTRNLFRGDYTNIDNSKFTYRENVTLNLIEPQVDVTKKVTNGYLARGEEAVIQVRVVNSGTDDAFGINITDSIPTGTTLVATTDSIITGTATYTITDGIITFDELSLAPGEEIVLEYTVLTDSETIFGYDIDSEVTVSDFSNRDEADPLPARLYEAEVYEYNWNAKEALLVTSAPEIEVGRNQTFTYTVEAKPVGGAPVYDNTITIDISNLTELTEDVNSVSYIVKINGSEQTITASNITDGLYTFENIDLPPNETLGISFELETPKFLDFDTAYETNITAVGNNKLSAEIRLDGSNETDKDVDADDSDTGSITIVQKDFEAPTGTIGFIQDGALVKLTNKEAVDLLKYSATDNSEIVAVRFSENASDWYTLSELGLLEDSVKDILNITEEWNIWPFDQAQGDNSIISTLTTQLKEEGFNYRYMQLVDLDGNVNVVTGRIQKDTLPPSVAELGISPFEYDFSDPVVTATFDNYINFYALENTDVTSEVSQIGEYSYSFDGSIWSDWESMSTANNAVLLSFPEVAEEEYLSIYLKVRDLAGNKFPATLFDEIQYDKEFPLVSVNINDGAEYTNEGEVKLTLDIVDSKANVQEIRFNVTDFCDETIQSCAMTEWEDLNTSNFNSETLEWTVDIDKFLNRFWEEGEKEVCVQLRDRNANVTNIACNTIVLDQTAPSGFMVIDDGALQTNGFDVVLNIIASDPELIDGSEGAGNIQMRFSHVGQNCEELNNPDDKPACEETWTDWVKQTEEYAWKLEEYIGTHTVYVQYQDGVGNKSPIYSDEIVYNPYESDGNIVINNDNVFTNTKFVTLDLEVDIEDFVCEGCTQPLLMRFYKTNGDEIPTTPPNVSSPDDNQNGWTYWEEYQSTKGYDLDEGNLGNPDYGLKTVYVQYMLPNTQTTAIYSDTIIYAPYYGVEYQRDATWNTNDIENKVFGLGQIPSELITQDRIQVTFNAENTGSFTWPVEGNNPVRFSYTWQRTGGEDPTGAFGGEGNFTAIDFYRGNSVVLPENISWDEQTGQISLNVDTPTFPGVYILKIDAVHEGEAWFGEYGNETPQYDIVVNENPDKVTPTPGIDPETGEVLGIPDDVEFGFGGNGGIPFPTDHRNCADTYGQNWAGTTCYIGGVLQRNSDFRYDYQIWGQQTNNPGSTKKFHFIPGPGYEHLLGQEVLAQVYYHNNSHQFWINWMNVAPKSWISEFRTNLNDSKIQNTIDVNRGMNFQIQPRLLNGGTAIWYSNENYLVAVGDKKYGQGGSEKASPFYDSSSWHSQSRIRLDNNHSGYGFNSVGRFTFDINIPDDISYGIHKQCFVMTNDPYRNWQRRDSFCLTFNVKMTYEEERDFVCSEPQEVYEERDTSSTVIGTLNENDSFVVTEDHGDWILGYLPTSGEQGWIDRPDGTVGDNYDCFDNIVQIETPIPAPDFDVIPGPEGDKGYVISIGDIPVKDGPADSFNTITSISFGTEVQVLGEANLTDRFGGWLYVRVDKDLCEESELTDGNCEGWIPKGTLQHVNDPKDIPVSFTPEYVKGHICGDDKQVRTGPGDWYPLATTETVGGNFNFAIIMKWEQPDGVWYQIYLDDNESGPFDLNTGWIKGLEDVCEGIFVPIYNPACSGQLAWPFEQKWTITSRHRSVNPARPTHDGLDIGAPLGTPVLAAADGYISYAGADQHGGLFVDVIHPSLGVKTRYLHLSYIDRFSGDVKVGQQVGLNGSTGLSTGPHLHFAVFDLQTGYDMNPEIMLGGGAGACEFEGEDSQDVNRIGGGGLEILDLEELADEIIDEYEEEVLPEKLSWSFVTDSELVPDTWTLPIHNVELPYLTTTETFYPTEGEAIDVEVPFVATKRESLFGKVVITNLTGKDQRIRGISDSGTTDLRIRPLTDKQFWLSFNLTELDDSRSYYFTSCSKTPSAVNISVGDGCSMELKNDIVIKADEVYKEFLFKGTIQRQIQEALIGNDDIQPHLGEYFQFLADGNFDRPTSNTNLLFKIGAPANDPYVTDLKYKFSDNYVLDELLPAAACASSLIVGPTFSMVYCVSLTAGEALNRGYWTDGDSIVVGLELITWGTSKFISNGVLGKYINRGFNSTDITDDIVKTQLAVRTNKKYVANELAKKSDDAILNAVKSNGKSIVKEADHAKLLEYTSRGLKRENAERLVRGVDKWTGTTLRPTSSDFLEQEFKDIMGAYYSNPNNIPLTDVNKLYKGIRFDGIDNQTKTFFEMKNTSGILKPDYQIKLELYMSRKLNYDYVLITQKGAESVSPSLQKLLKKYGATIEVFQAPNPL